MSKKNQESFQLAHVKVIQKNQGLSIGWTADKQEGGQIHKENKQVDSTVIPHEDLTKIMNKFKVVIATTQGVYNLRTAASSDAITAKQKEGFKAVQKITSSVVADLLERITITGVNISGDMHSKSGRGVIVTAKFKTLSNSVVPWNTPRIRLNVNAFGFEEELEENLGDLIEEVKAYLFENKKAQLDLLDEIENQEKAGASKA